MKKISFSNDLNKKRILLTGAAGKLGSHYIEILTNLGAFVIAVDLDYKKLDETILDSKHMKMETLNQLEFRKNEYSKNS